MLQLWKKNVDNSYVKDGSRSKLSLKIDSWLHQLLCFPGGSDGKESACNAGDPGSVPGLGRSPGEGNGYLFLYSCL